MPVHETVWVEDGAALEVILETAVLTAVRTTTTCHIEATRRPVTPLAVHFAAAAAEEMKAKDALRIETVELAVTEIPLIFVSVVSVVMEDGCSHYRIDEKVSKCMQLTKKKKFPAHLEYVAQHANAIFQQDDVGGNQRQSPPREIRGGRGQDRFPRHQENERRGLSPPQNGHREQDQVQNRNQEEESMEERLRRVEEMIRGIEQNIIDMAMGRQMMPQNHHHYHQEQIYQQHHHYHNYQQNPHQNRQPQVYWHNNHGGHQALHQHYDMEQHHHLGNWYGNPALQDHVHQGNDQQNQRYQHYHEHYHPHHPHQNRQPQINWHENHGGHQAHHQHHEVDHRQQDGNWDENRADHGEHQEHHPHQNLQPQINWHENHGGHQDRQEPDIPMLPPPRIREENGVAVIEYLPQQNQVLQRHPHGAPPAPFIFREHMPIDESFLLWFNYHITNHLNEGIVRDAELYRAVLRVDDHFPRPDVETFWRDLDEFRLRMLGPERPQTPESPQYSEPGSPGYIGPGEENGGVEEEPPREIAREELRVQEDNERVVEDPEEQWRPYSPGSPQYGPPEDRVEEQEVNFNSQQVQYRLRFFMQSMFSKIIYTYTS
ncbi:hypothetical protein GCK72_022331 [Caenorhabditis remanei]|uniref:Uncharacterized protein n=1 Tax=Caenorhabditis remanei TaxID=31234 RepID=A0A6A5FTJ6_CAERE|nr:hypothetical protein GCK72_022331 [Caenorhabditis remanei]KAF1745884.1 hypothetical protein GCK72_022331 [Caenorhabditis remanei]